MGNVPQATKQPEARAPGRQTTWRSGLVTFFRAAVTPLAVKYRVSFALRARRVKRRIGFLVPPGT